VPNHGSDDRDVGNRSPKEWNHGKNIACDPKLTQFLYLVWNGLLFELFSSSVCEAGTGQPA
jgi:hypothetical protein